MRNAPLILLIDDIPDHMHLYEGAMRARGYEVRLATTGADALAYATGTRPDCVVIDVRLPDVTGWELCKRLKAITHLKSTPVVILAPDLSKGSVAGSREAGCAAWLMRPASPDDVVRAVEHVLANGGSHPAAHEAMLSTHECQACGSDKIRAGVRVGPVQYFVCRTCGFRWRVDAQGEATA